MLSESVVSEDNASNSWSAIQSKRPCVRWAMLHRASTDNAMQKQKALAWVSSQPNRSAYQNACPRAVYRVVRNDSQLLLHTFRFLNWLNCFPVMLSACSTARNSHAVAMDGENTEETLLRHLQLRHHGRPCKPTDQPISTDTHMHAR